MKARHLYLIAAVALFAGFMPHERTAPARWAFLVGISDYGNFGDEIGGDLPGAAVDARAMRDVLIARWGFAPERVKLVADADAGRDGIRAGLTEWLPSVVRPGDLVVFFYAGHGSQVWDMNGDEPDGLDETICPADVLKGSSANDITDDELGSWLRALPTDNVTVILDSCHSGTATRAVTPFARPRSLARDAAEDLPKPGEAPDSTASGEALAGEPAPTPAAPVSTPSAATGDEEAMDGLGDDVLEISAAQADQVAVDAVWPSEDGGEPTYGGAFTTNLVRHLWQAPAGTSWSEVFSFATRDLKKQRFAQNPQISGPRSRSLFGLDGEAAYAVAPAAAPSGQPEQPAGSAGTRSTASGGSYVPVIATPEPGRATLGGGVAAGITERSIYQIGDSYLRIDDVRPDRAEASVVETRGIAAVRTDTIAPGARARLVAHRYPEAILRVSIADLPGSAWNAIESQLVSVPALALVRDRQAFAHLLVRPQGGDYVVYGLDGSVRHRVPAPTPAAGAEALVPLLENEFGQHQLAELDNPARPFALDFGFAGDKTRFRLGELIEFRVRSARDGYLTIVDLSADGKVTVIFPNDYDGNNFIRANQEITIPTAAMGFQFAATEPTGRQMVRAIVTEKPLILPYRTDGGFASADATQAGRVAQALRTAAGRPPVAGSDAVPVDNWMTSAIVYEITE